MPKLTIIRGVPGSGKTTLAKKKDGIHVEADMFFTDSHGVYTFNPKEIGQAHDWCQKQAATALEKGLDVVVSNTFTQEWEILPYYKMAQTLKVEFEVIKCVGEWDNIHNVPQASLDKMKARWQDWDGEVVYKAETAGEC